MGYERLVRGLCEAVPGIVAIYLFGSAARGEERADSDVDVAILGSCPLAAGERWTLQETAAATLRRNVDLVDLRTASTVMRMQVVSTGTLLFEADANQRARFEDLVFSSYVRLNEERRGILEDVLKRGSVYG